MTAVRTAVIGVGHQGLWHAEKLAALENSDLVAVVDVDSERGQAVADDLGVEALSDYRELIGQVSAVVIATPTPTHFEIAGTLLLHGIHLLIEKPLAATLDEARGLVGIAEADELILQVGHLERFNPAVQAIADRVKAPLFIESNRIAPYKPRGLDVSVVLDLMIHDIDLIHSFVRSPMTQVDAMGRSVFSDNIDVANARIRFENGCVANVTSSRISTKTERSLRIFQGDSYLSADMQDRTFSFYSKKGEGPVRGPDDVLIEKRTFNESDALMEQSKAFLETVVGGEPPLVSGRIALQALETATVIGEKLGNQ